MQTEKEVVKTLWLKGEEIIAMMIYLQDEKYTHFN
jgi:hypothetical protein